MARDTLGVEVDAGDLEPGLAERHRERQAGVAEPDDADLGLAGGDAVVEGGGRRRALPSWRAMVARAP